jgi:hypothetical protein
VDKNGLEAEIIKIGDSTCKALNFRGMWIIYGKKMEYRKEKWALL